MDLTRDRGDGRVGQNMRMHVLISISVNTVEQIPSDAIEAIRDRSGRLAAPMQNFAGARIFVAANFLHMAYARRALPARNTSGSCVQVWLWLGGIGHSTVEALA